MAALVDARFNPAGVKYLDSTGHIGRMWEQLDHGKPTYDPVAALENFIAAWRGRGTARYQERHGIRVGWFREGVEAMMKQDQLSSVIEPVADALNYYQAQLQKLRNMFF